MSTACLLGLGVFFVYLTNLRPMGAWDSVPARLLPFSILREGNFDLNEFHWLRRVDPHPYFMRETPSGKWLSRYTIGVPLLVTPLSVPVVWWLQRNHVPDDDVRFRLATVIMERIGAAAIAGLSVTLVCLAVSASTSTAMAVAIAGAYGLGTSIWSVGSQALWQHAMAALALAGLNLCLLAPDTRRAAAGAGSWAALAVLARPTMVVFALLALAFMWRERRRRLLAFLSVPIIGSALLLAYNLSLIGVLTGAYMRGRFGLPQPTSLAGLLVSPSRGLLVYTPAALLALPTVWRRAADTPRWVTYLPFGIAAYLLLYSAWPGWWAGYCYGPRFLTDVLPALVLCAVPTVKRWWSQRSGRMAIVLLVGWGVAVQIIGVYCDDRSWDALPKPVDRAPWRLWQWDDPQILRAVRTGWHATELGPLLWQSLTDPQPAVLHLMEKAELAGDVAVDGQAPSSFRAGSRSRLRLRVTNRSAVTWPVFSDFGYLEVELLYSWWRQGTMIPGEGGFIKLPRNLAPGATDDVSARIDAPAHSGTYELRIELVQVVTNADGRSGGAVLQLPARVE